MELHQQLEGLLFYKAAPMKKAALQKMFTCDEAALTTAITLLQERLAAGATRLVVTDSEVELVTAPELDAFIENLRKDEMKRDIGKAGAETLAIVAYRGPVTRGEIDRIRGVNSAFILRHLLVRGLVEKTGETRNVSYRATASLLAHLGITEKTSLPEYETIMNTLDAHEESLAKETA